MPASVAGSIGAKEFGSQMPDTDSHVSVHDSASRPLMNQGPPAGCTGPAVAPGFPGPVVTPGCSAPEPRLEQKQNLWRPGAANGQRMLLGSAEDGAP
mmetsp:Transcript_12848/g.30474  ORF Transcript_12848/g.30474 Transcript_12848/m.30474 type:complete len:97 (+) Transcript_12848:1298-1588(+)